MSYPSMTLVFVPVVASLCVPPQATQSNVVTRVGYEPIETKHAFSVQVSAQQQHHEDEHAFRCCQCYNHCLRKKWLCC